jgi:hypothetical protein
MTRWRNPMPGPAAPALAGPAASGRPFPHRQLSIPRGGAVVLLHGFPHDASV